MTLKIFIKTLMLFILCLNLSACSITIDRISTDPKLHTKSVGDDIKISLPARYRDDTYYRSAIVFVKDIKKSRELMSVICSSGAEYQKDELNLLIDNRVALDTQTEIESRLQRIKRLNIIRYHSKQIAEGKNEMEADESGESIGDNVETRQINHIIALELKQTKDIQPITSKKDMALYKSILSYQIIKLTRDGGTVLEGDTVEGWAKRYKEYYLRWNKKTKVYDRIFLTGEKDFDVEQAFLQATCRASLILLSRLGNAFPIVAKITGSAEDNLELNAGSKIGIVDNQVFIIYTEDEGRDRAFALAKVIKVEKDISELKLFRWSKSPFAKPIIKVIRENNSLVKQRDYYAVSAGLPPDFFANEPCTKKK